MPSDGIQDLEGLGSPSRTISSAGLSSLSPLNAAARSSLSFVQPRYSISQTRRGSTHRTSFSTPTGSGLAICGFVELIFSSSLRSDLDWSLDHPVPTRPA